MNLPLGLFLFDLFVAGFPSSSLRPLTFSLFSLGILIFLISGKEVRLPRPTRVILVFLFFIFPLLLQPNLAGFSDVLFISILLLVYGVVDLKRAVRWKICLLLGLILAIVGALRVPSLLNLSLFFLFLFLSIWILSFLNAGSSPSLRELLDLTLPSVGLLLVLTLSLSIPIFLFLPRPHDVVLDFSAEAKNPRSGLSDEVRLGEIGTIKRSPKVIFRAKSGRILDEFLYWRGVVLDSFDGKVWYGKRGSLNPLSAGKKEGILQEIELETPQRDILPGLNLPLGVEVVSPFQILSSPGVTFLSPDARRGFTYKVYSSPNSRDRGPPTSRDLLLYPQLRKEVRELALKLLPDTTQPLSTALKFSQYVKHSNSYSLELASTGKDPIYHFLFQEKRGNCEYFAAALAILLRSVGIPARLVAGFKGGIYNPYGGYYLVRGYNAHVWVEVWDPSEGWVTFDPTPSGMGSLTRGEMGWLQGIRDLLKVRLRSAFTGYSSENQLKLVKTMWDVGKRSIPYLGLSLVLIILSFLLRKSIRRKRAQRTLHPAARLFLSFERSLKRKGLKRKRGETPLQFLKRVGGGEGEQAASLYYRIRYGGFPFEDLRKLRLQLRSLLSRIHQL